MTGLGFVAILLSLLALPVAVGRAPANRVLLFLALVAVHLAATIVYYLYVQTTSADASIYYYDGYGMSSWPFAFGTVFTVQLVQTIKAWVGGTYLDHFLLFQSFGLWGLAFIMRSISELHDRLGVEPSGLALALLFFPGMHFWTSAIGKDAPMFLGISLSVWAALELPRRAPAFAAGLAIMVLFRPHLALACALALAISELFGGRSNRLYKVLLLTASAAAIAIILGTVESALQADVTSAGGVGSFLDRQSAVAATVSGNTAVLNAPFIVRLLSLLYRPFFFDAGGVFGLISSMENLFMLFMTATIAANHRIAARLIRRNAFFRFVAILTATVAVLLTLVYYNVGLGARQRVMMFPALFCFFAAVWAVRSAQRRLTIPGGPAEEPQPFQEAIERRHA